MEQLIIENLLPVPVYAKVEMIAKKDEETSRDIIEASLYFNPPACAEPELHLRKIESGQQYAFDLPSNTIVNLNLGVLINSVDLTASQNNGVGMLTLINFKSASA